VDSRGDRRPSRRYGQRRAVWTYRGDDRPRTRCQFRRARSRFGRRVRGPGRGRSWLARRSSEASRPPNPWVLGTHRAPGPAPRRRSCRGRCPTRRRSRIPMTPRWSWWRWPTEPETSCSRPGAATRPSRPWSSPGRSETGPRPPSHDGVSRQLAHGEANASAGGGSGSVPQKDTRRTTPWVPRNAGSPSGRYCPYRRIPSVHLSANPAPLGPRGGDTLDCQSRGHHEIANRVGMVSPNWTNLQSGTPTTARAGRRNTHRGTSRGPGP
jgi:hypothetical protein